MLGIIFPALKKRMPSKSLYLINGYIHALLSQQTPTRF